MGCVAFGLPEFKVNRVLESTDGRSLRYEVETREKPTKCPSCGATGKLTIHASHNREVHDLSICNKLVYLRIKFKRYKCHACGKTFIETVESVDDSMFTKRLREEIVNRVLMRDTFTRIASDYAISDKSVRRLFDDWAKVHRYMLDYDTPRILGLDEAHIDDKYRLVVVDIENNMLLDMLPNNQPQMVISYLKQLDNKDNVEAVTMDFFKGYANYVEKAFAPHHPLIIIDKFHVIQLINRHMDSIRKSIHRQEQLSSTKVAKKLKNERKLFMANIEDLDEVSRNKVEEWSKLYPQLGAAHALKEQFRAIYQLPNRELASKAFDQWCNDVPDVLPEFISLRDTLAGRREHILNYFDSRFTNAFAESANNIIKGIEKQGKGYSFDTLREIALFSVRTKIQEKFMAKNATYIESWKF